MSEQTKHVEELIQFLGEDPSRDGLEKTPQRYLKSLQFLTSGYKLDVKKIINGPSSTFPITIW
jgi:GTP cyclohydrolase I